MITSFCADRCFCFFKNIFYFSEKEQAQSKRIQALAVLEKLVSVGPCIIRNKVFEVVTHQFPDEDRVEDKVYYVEGRTMFISCGQRAIFITLKVLATLLVIPRVIIELIRLGLRLSLSWHFMELEPVTEEKDISFPEKDFVKIDQKLVSEKGHYFVAEKCLQRFYMPNLRQHFSQDEILDNVVSVITQVQSLVNEAKESYYPGFTFLSSPYSPPKETVKHRRRLPHVYFSLNKYPALIFTIFNSDYMKKTSEGKFISEVSCDKDLLELKKIAYLRLMMQEIAQGSNNDHLFVFPTQHIMQESVTNTYVLLEENLEYLPNVEMLSWKDYESVYPEIFVALARLLLFSGVRYPGSDSFFLLRNEEGLIQMGIRCNQLKLRSLQRSRCYLSSIRSLFQDLHSEKCMQAIIETLSHDMKCHHLLLVDHFLTSHAHSSVIVDEQETSRYKRDFFKDTPRKKIMIEGEEVEYYDIQSILEKIKEERLQQILQQQQEEERLFSKNWCGWAF